MKTPHLLDNLGNPERGTLKSTHKTGINYGGAPQLFLGQFFLNIKHTAKPVSYLARLYIFEDTISPTILLSNATCDWLAIQELNVPNEASTLHIDSPKTKSKNVPHLQPL